MNIASYIILGIIVILCMAAVYKMINDKKKGKSCCGGDCSRCSSCGTYGQCTKDRKEIKDDKE